MTRLDFTDFLFLFLLYVLIFILYGLFIDKFVCI
jgi:hypothetical protein